MSWPTIPDSRSAALVALLAQLEQSQWYSAEHLAALQSQQLAKLFDYASQHSAFYQRRFGNSGIEAGMAMPDVLTRLPLTTRHELQTQAAEINCRVIPKEHGGFVEAQSSGSTGQMVVVRRTEACMQFWLALTLREHLWHRRDFMGTLAAIRPTIAEHDTARAGIAMPDWGPPVSLLFDSGPAYGLNLMADVTRQADWLTGIDPHYLLTFPTNVEALIRHYESHGSRLKNLQQVRTVGETVSAELRKRCRGFFGVDIIDTYSSQEIGVVAVQCPDSDLYHVMSENLIVEVLDDDGRPCAPGETGRIVITDLHNFATPLIRYDTRDYAEVGPSCPCGRGLAVLARVVGRSRNMVVFPDGRRHWPVVGAYHFRDIAPVSQYQVIQHDLTEMEVRLVVERPLSPEQEEKLAELIQSSLGHPFRMRFSYFDNALPRGKSGKFEEFICLIEHSNMPL